MVAETCRGMHTGTPHAATQRETLHEQTSLYNHITSKTQAIIHRELTWAANTR